jgi:Methylase involved in ubiquinone/menaquinone biosynthesis
VLEYLSWQHVVMNSQIHWENIYTRKLPTEVSWYQSIPKISLAFIQETKLEKGAAIIDVGGGSSTLVDHLLNLGFTQLTVLDIAEQAIEKSKARLGSRAQRVRWLVQDITQLHDGRRYDLWHDRALFHFLLKEDDRKKYFLALQCSLKPSGFVILATFGPEGPEQCSGLVVRRYSAGGLQKELGKGFHLLRSVEEYHQTPAGGQQQFVYCLFHKR